MDYAKVAKLTSDAGFEASEIKAAVAALENVLVNAAKYNCDDVVLENELQQLGELPASCMPMLRAVRNSRGACCSQAFRENIPSRCAARTKSRRKACGNRSLARP
eukprot:3589416-Rhodomonas_salina.3